MITVKQNQQFTYLNGFRGTLVLWVLMQHIVDFFVLEHDYTFFRGLGTFLGVPGFFILSSFLLTNILLREIEPLKDKRFVSVVFIKYFIKRFFRIYLPFVAAVAIFYFSYTHKGHLIFLEGYKDYDWFQLITLQYAGFTHFWTIAPECKYYFFIPFFALFVRLTKKWWPITNLFLIFSIYFLPELTESDLPFGYKLKIRFATFYLGSLVAVYYYQMESFLQTNFIFRSYYFKQFFGFLTLAFYVYSLTSWSEVYSKSEDVDFNKAGRFSGLLLLLMLTGAPNFFTNIFENNFLMLIGKYSFGIYLLHPIFLEIVKLYKTQAKFQFEFTIYVFFCSYSVGLVFYYLIEENSIKLGQLIFNKLAMIINSNIFNSRNNAIANINWKISSNQIKYLRRSFERKKKTLMNQRKKISYC